MTEDIKIYIENNLKYFQLEGVEITDEDIKLVEQKIKHGKSLEEACYNILSGIRECLDEGFVE